MKQILFLSVFAGLVLGLIACGSGGETEASSASDGPASRPAADTIAITVSNFPLAYFTERIGGDHVEVTFPAEGDGDPAFWEPSIEAIQAMNNAELIVFNGATYEKWAPTVSIPARRVINTAKTFENEWLELEKEITHSHGPGGEHSHTGIQFTTWLKPDFAITQAEGIRDALIKARPDQESSFQEGFASLEADLRKIDERFADAFRGHEDQPLVASHPVYGYLEQEYNLNLESVHWEPDSQPTTEMWDELREVLTTHAATLMVWEGEPLPAVEQELLEIGIRSVVFDPAGNTPENGDFVETMLENAERIKAVLDGQG